MQNVSGPLPRAQSRLLSDEGDPTLLSTKTELPAWQGQLELHWAGRVLRHVVLDLANNLGCVGRCEVIG